MTISFKSCTFHDLLNFLFWPLFAFMFAIGFFVTVALMPEWWNLYLAISAIYSLCVAFSLLSLSRAAASLSTMKAAWMIVWNVVTLILCFIGSIVFVLWMLLWALLQRIVYCDEGIDRPECRDIGLRDERNSRLLIAVTCPLALMALIIMVTVLIKLLKLVCARRKEAREQKNKLTALKGIEYAPLSISVEE
ncbi:hypothetical protein QOT17_019762 [Balamuthia mandrillaris]